MRASFKKFALLWTLAAILCSFLALWQIFDAHDEQKKPSLFSYLDRYWAAVKQDLQQRYQPNSFRFLSKIRLLEIPLSNRSDFWLKPKLIHQLAVALNSYQGPIILNLDPRKAFENPELKKLLRKKNVIHPFTTEESAHPDIPLEHFVSTILKQPHLSLMSARLSLVPDKKSYFEEPYAYGSLSYVQDQATSAAQFISSYPLALQGAHFYLPTIVLATLKLMHKCDSFSMPYTTQVDCLKKNQIYRSWKNPLPLYFYKEPIQTIELREVKNSKSILIVDPIDASSFISNFHGNRMTWGDLVATALSNVLQDQTPWQNGKLLAWELIQFLLLASLIIYVSFAKGIRATITTAVIVLLCFPLLDALLTIFTNARSTPIEEFIALSFLALTGISTRTRIDFEERSLIERALSGYVSQERLKRLLYGKEKLLLSGHKRKLTSLLLDIRAFSQLTHTMAPEQVFDLIQTFFSIVDPLIFACGGTIDKKTGDGLLAFFGDYEKEDEPKRAALSAVGAALAIQDKLNQLQNEQPKIFHLDQKLQCRIGINSGEVMIGNAGSERHFNYTILGEAVNFTQRLEAACPPQRVLVGGKTAELIQEKFKLCKTEIKVKHQEELADAYLVEGPRA